MMSRTAWLTTALVVLALFVGSVLDTRLPKPDPADADPFLRPGLVGQAVELRNGVVTATDVRVGTEIRSIGAITATTGSPREIISFRPVAILVATPAKFISKSAKLRPAILFSSNDSTSSRIRRGPPRWGRRPRCCRCTPSTVAGTAAAPRAAARCGRCAGKDEAAQGFR